MRFTCEGKEYEFRGEYQEPKNRDWYLTNYGTIQLGTEGLEDLGNRLRAIVYPVPVTHVFGGVEFEETGDVETPHAGQWFVVNSKPVFVPPEITPWGKRYPILRPVRIVE